MSPRLSLRINVNQQSVIVAAVQCKPAIIVSIAAAAATVPPGRRCDRHGDDYGRITMPFQSRAVVFGAIL